MSYNIFISRPTVIAPVFEPPYVRFEKYMKRFALHPCRLGGDNFTLDAPLIGVINLMKQCQGAIVLGYPQYEFTAKITKSSTPNQQVSMKIPTPWNHIEATLAFSQNIPVLVVAHKGVLGGVFDLGVTGQYMLLADLTEMVWYKTMEFKGVFGEWKERLK